MSGGFFRGTSADQDTRFSNKQAKLLKSQKFAPELDQRVSMAKVKLDVIRPWIATRVTELLGVEDEVLINFIYGLLEVEDADGKHIQIQLTGFMERNTGKFMKELWNLLLSAQKNESGIPQQFLDAKQEEARRKKVDADRIAHEIQMRKEKETRESEMEKQKKVDGEVVVPRAGHIPLDDAQNDEDRKADEKNGARGKSRSPCSLSVSPNPRSSSLLLKSVRPSVSRSRSVSDGGSKLRSPSRSPVSCEPSVSPRRRYISPCRLSISPRRRHLQSPPRRRSPIDSKRTPSPRELRPYSPRRHRSRSPGRHRSHTSKRYRSPSPRQCNSPSPWRRGSSPPLRRLPSPHHRRSPSPWQRKSLSPRRRWLSPRSRRDPSPMRQRSPLMRQRSPSPVKHTPPFRKLSPVISRSISSRHRCTSPGRSSPSQQQISISPLRAPLPKSPQQSRKGQVGSPGLRVRSQIYAEERYRPDSSFQNPSPNQSDHRSMSRELSMKVIGSCTRGGSPCRHTSSHWSHQKCLNREHGTQANGGRARRDVDNFVLGSALEIDDIKNTSSGCKMHGLPRTPSSSKSPQHYTSDKGVSHDRSVRQDKSILRTSSPSGRFRKSSLDCRTNSVNNLPKSRESTAHRSHEEVGRDVKIVHPASEDADVAIGFIRAGHTSHTYRSKKMRSPSVEGSPDRSPVSDSVEARDLSSRRFRRSDNSPLREIQIPEKRVPQEPQITGEYAPGRIGGEGSFDHIYKHGGRASSPDEKVLLKKSNIKDDYKARRVKQSVSCSEGYADQACSIKAARNLSGKSGLDDQMYESDTWKRSSRSYSEKRKYKREESPLTDESDYDSPAIDKREAKRRRKEEKKLRKEEKRRRREERRRRREEARVGKLKYKHVDTVTPPSDIERNNSSDDNFAARANCLPSDSEDPEMEQKKLEIELRKKALESLRAKKAINH